MQAVTSEWYERGTCGSDTWSASQRAAAGASLTVQLLLDDLVDDVELCASALRALIGAKRVLLEWEVRSSRLDRHQVLHRSGHADGQRAALCGPTSIPRGSSRSGQTHQRALGTHETRPAKSDCADELLRCLGNLKTRIDTTVRSDLFALAHKHKTVRVMVERSLT